MAISIWAMVWASTVVHPLPAQGGPFRFRFAERQVVFLVQLDGPLDAVGDRVGGGLLVSVAAAAGEADGPGEEQGDGVRACHGDTVARTWGTIRATLL
jgi:hypothetical protein